MDFQKLASVVLASRRVARGSEGDMLGAAGREAEIGQDEASVQTHHDLDPDDIENVDTRPGQGV